MKERHDELDETDLPGTDLRLAREGEEARELAEHVVGSVREHDTRSHAIQLARERRAGELRRVSRVADHRPEMIVFPGFDEVRYERGILTEHVAELSGFDGQARKSVDM